MKKVLYILLLSVVLISGCARQQQESGVRLLFWSSTNPYEIEFARERIAEWNEAHPDTQVVLQPLPEGRSGEEVLIIAAAGGTAPDICANVPPVIVPLLAKAQALVPLDRFPDGRQTMEERLPDGLLETFIASDGNLYQIPWKGNSILVQYNMGLLREAGVTELPTTWSEWNEVARLVSKDNDGDGQFDQWMADFNVVSEWRQRLFDFYTFYIAASGGETLLRNGQVHFDNQSTRDVFQFVHDGYRLGYYPNSIFVGDIFLRGSIAAHVTGPWNIAHVERFKPEGFEYAFGPIPVPDDYEGDHYTFGDPKSIGIFSTTDHPEAAWAFCRFYTSRQADLRLLEITNQLPLRRDLLTDSLFAGYFDENPMMRPFAEKVPFTRGFDQNTALQEVFDAINSEWDAVCIQGRREVEAGVQRAIERSERILRLRGS